MRCVLLVIAITVLISEIVASRNEFAVIQQERQAMQDEIDRGLNP